MNLELNNSQVLVIGGTKGIGLSIVKSFLLEGAVVHVISRNIDTQLKFELEIKYPSNIFFYQSDAIIEESLNKTYPKILENSKINSRYFDSLRGYIKRGVETGIVTARENKKLVVDFFKYKNVNIKSSLIYAVHNPATGFSGSISERKKQAVKNIIDKGYNNIVFYDDNLDNLLAVQELESSKVKIKIIHVLECKKENRKARQ